MLFSSFATATQEAVKEEVTELTAEAEENKKQLEKVSQRALDKEAEAAKAKEEIKGLNKFNTSLKNIETSIENVGKIEIYNLEKNLSLLATISGAAPMIGFLGTVTGMIQAFISIAEEEGAVSPKLLSSGIYEAMLTTAAGLFVGIIAYLSYNYLVSRVEKLIHKMEYTTIEFIEILQSKK